MASASITALAPPQAGAVVAGAASAGLVSRLEQALNASDRAALEALLAPAQREQLAPRLQRFAQRFGNARWRLTAGAALPDGRLPVAVRVSGTTQKDDLLFSLEAAQDLLLTTEAGLITGQEVRGDRSVLVNARGSIPVTLQIPDAVLTGSRYDVDVVLDEPLGQALLAGGLTALTPEQVQEQRSPDIQLEPMGGGGLFKSVQAPFQPGVQTWAAMLVHPDGVITVTKQVRVVSDKSQLNR